MNSIECHFLNCDEERILPYTLKHYTSFCNKVVMHDLGSQDNSKAIAAAYGVEVRDWDSGNKVNDLVNLRVKNECWQDTDADWVIVADTDELIFFPHDREATLQSYLDQKIYMVRPTGFEMFSEKYPTTPGQIYDEIKMGARDNVYSKPVLFYPKMIVATNFRPGAHSSDAEFKDGRRYENPVDPPVPPCYLLHFHQIMPIEQIAAKYDRTRARMCQSNIDNNWGNVHMSGKDHAQQKRDWIVPRLERVIP